MRNLNKKFSADHLSRFIGYLAKTNLRKIDFINEDEFERFKQMTADKDIHVLAGAAKAKADYLVTLDKKHLLIIKKSKLLFLIITPGELIRLMLS